MASIFNTCTVFLHLLILYMIHGNLARELPKEMNKYDDSLCLNHGCNHIETIHTPSSSSSSSPSYMDHIPLSWHILFHIEDLKLGRSIKLYFPIKDSSQTLHFIPKQEADLIPFSSSSTEKILKYFSFSRDSPQAKAIKMTLHHCEVPPLKGETKFCATSLESMLEKLALLFGQNPNFRVLTTTKVKNWAPHLQNYTILENPKEINVTKMFGCHPLPYPYAVYYCHGQDSDNKLFRVSLKGDDGLRLQALAICHMDTSHWDPNHASFRVLGIRPGSAPVCHVFPRDNLVWVSSPDYVD
ncbi:hypothetical protein RND81_09G175600 [Saponaria officinalis]|uniref:BURP domain-containing protein n=1 Tax=Saponaria officinalis TaxID=3572 RepID=A0AAW1IP13_SAPOF